MRNKVTMADIAKELGVSVPTVHRAINNLGRVSAKTQKRVLDKAKEMGYNTNIALGMLSSKEMFKAALILPNIHFYDDILKGFKASLSQYELFQIDYDVLYTNEFNALEQVALLESLIESEVRYSVIALPSAHPVILNPQIDRLVQSGTEVITFDNDAPNSIRKIFIGPNGYVSGKVCAELYNRILPEGATVAVLPSFVTAVGLKERVRGFKDICAENNKLKIVGTFEFSDNEQDAYSVCKQVLSSIKPDAIYCNSMNGTQGICKAIIDTNNVGKVFAIGYDLNASIKKHIKNGVLFGSIYQHPYMQGSNLANIMMQICLGSFGVQEKNIYIKTMLVLNSNLDEFSEEYSLALYAK